MVFSEEKLEIVVPPLSIPQITVQHSGKEDEEFEDAEETTSSSLASCRFSSKSARFGGVSNMYVGAWTAAAGHFLVGLSLDPCDSLLAKGFTDSVYHIRHSREYWEPSWRRVTEDVYLTGRRHKKAAVDEKRTRKLHDDFDEVYSRMNIRDLLDKSADSCDHIVRDLKGSLKSHYVMLRKMFKLYARLDFSGLHSISENDVGRDEDCFLISKREFQIFVKDCKLVGGALTAPMVDIIFVISTRRLDPHGRILAVGQKDGMQLFQFLQAVVRIAQARYKHLPSLHDRFESCVTSDVLPHARYDTDDTLTIRRLMASKAVEAVLEKHSAMLRRLFAKYAAADAAEARENKAKLESMNIREFFKLLNEYSLLDERVNQKEVANIFVLSQADPVVPDDVTLLEDTCDDNLKEMQYEEFVEGLCRVAATSTNHISVRGNASNRPPSTADKTDAATLSVPLTSPLQSPSPSQRSSTLPQATPTTSPSSPGLAVGSPAVSSEPLESLLENFFAAFAAKNERLEAAAKKLRTAGAMVGVSAAIGLFSRSKAPNPHVAADP